jgi:thiamine biosynthesis lipoprotein
MTVSARQTTLAAALLMGLAAVSGALAGRSVAAPAPASVERELYLMGTRASVAVTADSHDHAMAGAERAVRALESAEARLSTWRPESELSRLTKAPAGAPVRLSPALHRELAAAFRCADETDGAFDPAIGALVDAWGLRGSGRVPGAAEIAATLADVDPAGMTLDGALAVRHRGGLRLEEGGWGKGAGLDAAMASLTASPGVRGSWIDLGGQAAVLGDAPWEPTLADPDDRSRAVVRLTLAGGSLSTSGNSEHGLVVDGRRIGHLLDPRSGRPAADFGALAVWAPQALRADCLSTGLYVLGPERALAFAAAHPEVQVLVLERTTRGLRARASAGLYGRVVPLVDDLELSFAEAPVGRLAGKTEGAAGRFAWQRGPAAP